MTTLTGTVPQDIVLFGDAALDTGGLHSVDPNAQASVDFFLPDFAEPLRVSCERADMLVEVLEEFARSGTLPQAPQDGDEGLSYCVIHPFLKHLALLSREHSS